MKLRRIVTVSAITGLALAVSLVAAPRGRAADDVVELKFANYFPPPSGQSKLCEEFVQELEKRTNGKVKVRYFPGGSLLSAPAMMKGIEGGIADMGLAHIEYTPGRFPVTEVCDLPLGYPTAWVASQIVNDFYKKFQPKEWEKVRVLWLHANGPSVMITKKPVRTMEDMKGLTIRAPGRLGEVIQSLGGTPAPTPVVETYDAISKGVLDGSFTGTETVKTFRFGEVAKNVTLSWQVGSVYTFFVAMNKRSYEKLPADVRPIFDALCEEFKDKTALMWNNGDFGGVEFGKSKGVEFIDLSDKEAARWEKAVEPVINSYVKSMVAAGHSEAEVRGWISFLRERNKALTARQRELKIKSVTGPKSLR